MSAGNGDGTNAFDARNRSPSNASRALLGLELFTAPCSGTCRPDLKVFALLVRRHAARLARWLSSGKDVGLVSRAEPGSAGAGLGRRLQGHGLTRRGDLHPEQVLRFQPQDDIRRLGTKH